MKYRSFIVPSFNVMAVVAAAVLLASCFGMPQFSAMPDGPLQEFYFYENHYSPTDPPICEVRLWRENGKTSGGLLTYIDEDYADMDNVEVNDDGLPVELLHGDTVRVDESVFRKVFALVEDNQLYRLHKNYSTWLKGDSYAYHPWTVRVVLPADSIETHSDGTRTRPSLEAVYVAVDYLKAVYLKARR